MIIVNRRPKLSEVSLSEFNIANTRILFRLIETGQLPTFSDLKDYLVYSVKINQLASKFSWQKVLKYDGEYRLAQAKYSFPWSYDSHHMHTVLLSFLHPVTVLGPWVKMSNILGVSLLLILPLRRAMVRLFVKTLIGSEVVVWTNVNLLTCVIVGSVAVHAFCPILVSGIFQL